MATPRAAKTAPAEPAPEDATETAPRTGAEDGAEAGLVEGARAGALKKRELIERVAAETGLKRREVKAVAESVLSVMARALGEGQSLNLEPLGKLRVARSTDNADGRVLTCKLRQKGAALPSE